MVLMPEDFEAAYEGVLAAVKDGTINEARIDDSLARVYKIKYKETVDK
jgi:beta-N-acetylhexosaminidase